MKRNFEILHVRLHPSEQIGIHRHYQWEISYVIDGEGIRTIGKISGPFRKGDIVMVPPDMPHCWIFDDTEQIECMTILFEESFIRAIADVIPEMHDTISLFCRNRSALTFTDNTKRNLAEILTLMLSESQELRIADLLKLITTIAGSEQKSIVGEDEKSLVAQKLEKIDIYLACNHKRNISIESIARHVGMNRSSVCSFYRRHTGKTLMTHLIELRIDAAKYLLKDRSRSIQQICIESGFNDTPYFCRIFKKSTGLTPTQYRESLFHA